MSSGLLLQNHLRLEKQLSKPVIVLGGGGHASVLVEILLLNSMKIVGVSDPGLEKGKLIFDDIPVINDDMIIDDYSANSIKLVNGVGPSTKSKNRNSLNKKFVELGYEFSSVIHPLSLIAKSAILETGSQVMSGAIIQSGSNIGFNTIINTGSVIDHDCTLGNNNHIAPGAVLCGSVSTGSDVFIGAGATIIENLSIGDGALVAAGATLRKNLEANEVYYG